MVPVDCNGICCILQLLDDTAGIAHGDGVAGDVPGDDRAGTDGHVVADGHARQDGHRAPDPHIVADGHRQCPFAARVTLNRVSTVAGRVDAHVRPDKAIVADGHQRLVKHREIEVGEEPFTHADVLAIVAKERLVDQDVVIAHMPQQALQHRRAFSPLRRQQLIVAVNDILTLIQLLQQLRVNSRVGQSSQHFLFLGHSPVSSLVISGKVTNNSPNHPKGIQKNKSALLSRAMLTIMFNPKKPPKIMSSNLYLQLPCQT